MGSQVNKTEDYSNAVIKKIAHERLQGFDVEICLPVNCPYYKSRNNQKLFLRNKRKNKTRTLMIY